MKYKALMIDIGGVLVNDFVPALHREIAVKNDVDEKELNRLWKMHERAFDRGEIDDKEFFQLIFDELSIEKDFDQFYRESNEIFKLVVAQQADVVNFFLDLREEQDMKQVIVSNIGRRWNTYYIEKFQFDELFDACIFSCDLGAVKPEPDIFFEGLKAVGVKKEDTIFIDDKEDNVDAARELGIRAIKFTTLDELKEELEKQEE